MATKETLIDAEHASFSVKITLAFAFFSLLLLLLSAGKDRQEAFLRRLNRPLSPVAQSPCIIFNILVLSRNSSLKISLRN